jgi:hypothetical protein
MPHLGTLRHLLSIRELHGKLHAHFYGCVSVNAMQNITIDQFLTDLNGKIFCLGFAFLLMIF